jgi:hypothetical protein
MEIEANVVRCDIALDGYFEHPEEVAREGASFFLVDLKRVARKHVPLLPQDPSYECEPLELGP